MSKLYPDLTNKDICDIRVEILKTLVQTASKVGLEKGEIESIAEKHFEFVTKPIVKEEATPEEPPK